MEMFRCPNCGGNELRGKYCAFCGSMIWGEPQKVSQEDVLQSTTQQEPDISVFREYDGCNSRIVLQEDAIVIHNERWNKERCTKRIPYEQIRGLHCYRSKDRLVSWGNIVIRSTENEHLPVPSCSDCDLRKHDKEESIFSFASGEEEQVFIQIFWFLKAMSPAGVECSIEGPEKLPRNADALMESADFDWYFNNCNPFRKSAVYLLRKNTGVSKKNANALVNKVFDERQAALYEADPAQAERDLAALVKQALDNGWKWIVN